MSTRMTALACLVGSSLAFGGCSEPPKPKKKSPPKPQVDKGGEDERAEGSTGAGSEESSEPSVPGPGDDPLGSRFKDPAWYTPEIIAHTKIIQNGRSEAREDGTFSSALVLQLEVGMTPDKCLQELVGKVEGPELAFGEPEKGDDGRLTARSETERYRVTLVCGEAKGTPTAFVGYEWKPGV